MFDVANDGSATATGTVNALGGFISGASVGGTAAIIVTDQTGLATCTINFVKGLYITDDCP